MIIPDPNPPVPDDIRLLNGILFAKALSEDPAIKVMNLPVLIANLKAMMQHAGLFGSDAEPSEIGKFLNYQMLGANKAANLYSRGNQGYSIECANAVITQVLFIMHDDRFTTRQKEIYKGVGK